MKRMLLPLLPFAAFAAFAAAPVTPPAGIPNFCDQAFAMEVETLDHDEVSSVVTLVRAVPWVDVNDNHDKQMKVLSVLSQQQNKGGTYSVTVTETQTCDGGPSVRVATGSAYAEGVTLDGSNKVAREALKQADLITKRYEDREKAGAKVGWNHKNAKKVARDEATGQVVRDKKRD